MKAGHYALSPEDRQRVEQVERVARDGKAGLPMLVELLDDRSWAVRRAVVAALARLGDVAAPALCELVRTRRDNEARLAAAVDALSGSSGDVRAAVVALARADAPPAVICDALQVLGRRKERATMPLLVDLASHADDNVAVAAIEAMGRIGGPETVDPLLAALRSKNFFRAFPAIDALGRTHDPRVVAPLAALLDDPLYAADAARALGRTAQQSAIAPLTALLAKPGDALLRTAAVALSELAQLHEQRFGASGSLRDSFRAAVDARAANARVAACLATASPSEAPALVRMLGWLGDDAAVAKLLEIVDDDGPLGQAAAAALREIGDVAMPHLLAALREGGSARREKLLPLVGYSADAAEVVVACLDDPDAGVRTLACEALARAANTRVVPSLFRLLRDPHPRVSQAASSAIQSLGSLETKQLALVEARSSDPRVRRAALRIISYFGYPDALDILVNAATDTDDGIRDAAVGGLALLEDPRATAALVTAARHVNAKTRAAATRALGGTTGSPEVLARLREALEDPEAWVRYYACQSLARLRAHDAADLVVARIHDEAGQVRVAAVDALAHLRTQRAVAALTQAAESDDLDIRRAALLALGAVREPSTLPLLRAAATTADASTRLVAISALAEFDAPDVVPVLAHAASDPNESVHAAAIGFLGTRPGDAATIALIDLLGNAATRDRVVAALAVAPDGRTEAILGALERADAALASMLVSALVFMRRASGFAAIGAALTLDNVEARRAAASALASLRTREALEALARVGDVDSDPEVRRIAKAASAAR